MNAPEVSIALSQSSIKYYLYRKTFKTNTSHPHYIKTNASHPHYTKTNASHPHYIKTLYFSWAVRALSVTKKLHQFDFNFIRNKITLGRYVPCTEIQTLQHLSELASTTYHLHHHVQAGLGLIPVRPHIPYVIGIQLQSFGE